MSTGISFSELRWPPTPETLNARGQTFYSGPSWLYEAVSSVLHRDQGPTANALRAVENRGGDWGVLLRTEGTVAIEALIKVRQADRQLLMRTLVPVDGLTQLTYRVGDEGAMSLLAFGNNTVRPTQLRVDEEPLGPVSMEDRVAGVLLGLPDFRTSIEEVVNRGWLFEDLDTVPTDELYSAIQHGQDQGWRQAVDAVIGLNGVARLIEETPPENLSVNVIGDEPPVA